MIVASTTPLAQCRTTRRTQPMPCNDLLIAAHCLAENLVAVTANIDEFSRVPGLGVENWLS